MRCLIRSVVYASRLGEREEGDGRREGWRDGWMERETRESGGTGGVCRGSVLGGPSDSCEGSDIRETHKQKRPLV